MFASAVRTAQEFTRPVIMSMRGIDQKCKSAIGAFVVVNDEGWIITAAHIIGILHNLQDSRTKAIEREAKEEAIEKNRNLNAKARRRAIRKLDQLYGKEGILNHSAWWGWDGVTLKDVTTLNGGDVAIGRLEPFDAKDVNTYPHFVEPNDDLQIGTSLCRLGFPFHEIEPKWDAQSGNFELPPEALPIPFFPIEGIFTRQLLVGKHKTGYRIGFLETSSPGLRGQSGGPIIDRSGTVWAIQSQTKHLDLGFKAVTQEKPQKEEFQFLNVGWGTHPQTITGMFKDLKIQYQKAPPPK